jgi:hypothetical protein
LFQRIEDRILDLVANDLSKSAGYAGPMAARARRSADLTGIRQRGSTFQIRIFGGIDPATGKQVMHTGSATTQAAAIELAELPEATDGAR